MKLTTIFISLVVGLIVTLGQNLDIEYDVKFFLDREYKGKSLSTNLHFCCSLLNDWNNKFSSIIVKTCVVIYPDHHCQGKNYTIQGKSMIANLDLLDINDRITSFKKCP